MAPTIRRTTLRETIQQNVNVSCGSDTVLSPYLILLTYQRSGIESDPVTLV
jgi:hypothetical protein